MAKKDQPEWTTDGRSADYALGPRQNPAFLNMKCATRVQHPTPESFGKLRYGRRCMPPFPKLRFQLDGNGLGIEHRRRFLSLVCQVQSS